MTKTYLIVELYFIHSIIRRFDVKIAFYGKKTIQGGKIIDEESN